MYPKMISCRNSLPITTLGFHSLQRLPFHWARDLMYRTENGYTTFCFPISVSRSSETLTVLFASFGDKADESDRTWSIGRLTGGGGNFGRKGNDTSSTEMVMGCIMNEQDAMRFIKCIWYHDNWAHYIFVSFSIVSFDQRFSFLLSRTFTWMAAAI